MSKVSGMSGFFVKPAILTAAETLTRNNSGRTHFLDNAAGFTLTLPAPLKGLELEFIVKTAPTTSNYVITTPSGTIILGGVYTNDVTNPSDSDFETSGVATINFVKNASLRGDSIKLVSDGTNWYAKAFTAVYDGITLV